MDSAQRKSLAAKLHYANVAIVDARRVLGIEHIESTIVGSNLAAARDLIKEVIETLMEAPGMTDYYGNPTYRGNERGEQS